MRPKVSIASIEDAIRAGRGVGLRDAYLPWISITKRNTSSVSMQSRAKMPGLSRRCHFLSHAEYSMAHFLYWLGVKDVREQFPMWPWPHRQPLSAVIKDDRRDAHFGMSQVASEAGIRLRCYPGIKVPYVLSTDSLLSLDTSWHLGPLFAVSCKPRSKLGDTRSSDWVLERLELERRYWNFAGVSWAIADPSDLPKLFVRQLIWLAPLDGSTELRELIGGSDYAMFVDRFCERAERMPALNAIREAAKGFRWDDSTAHYLARTAMWEGRVDVNPLEPINMQDLLPLGGANAKTLLRDNLFSKSRNGVSSLSPTGSPQREASA